MPNNIIITPGSASIQFSGSANNDTIRLQVEPSGSVAFYGSSGSLFSIVDQLSGSLMSVNDISGLPVLEVFSDDRVVMGSFNKNTLVVTGSKIGIGKSTPNTALDVTGAVNITGSFTSTGSVAIYSGSFTASNGGNTVTIAAGGGSIVYNSPTGGFLRFRINNNNGLFFNGTGGTFAPEANGVVSLGNDSTRWRNLFTSGSIVHTGSLQVLSGSIHAINGGFTGSLLGTSSLALTAETASYFDGFITFPSGLDITGSLVTTGSQNITGSLSILGTTYLRTAVEHVVGTSSAPPTTLNYNVLDGAILFYSGSPTANWTLNFRGNESTTLNSIMPLSSSLTVTLITNTTTAYSSSAYQIDGTSITPRWQNGINASGNANSIDAHTFTIIKVSNTPTYLLLGSITKFT